MQSQPLTPNAHQRRKFLASRENSFPRMKEDMPVSFSIQSGFLQLELSSGTWRVGGLNGAALGKAPMAY